MSAQILLVIIIAIGGGIFLFTSSKARGDKKALRNSLIASLITPLREYENAGVYAGTAMKRSDHDTVKTIQESIGVALNAEPSQAHHALAHEVFMSEFYKAWGVDRKTTEQGAEAFRAKYGRK
jgi:hypothetical protein